MGPATHEAADDVLHRNLVALFDRLEPVWQESWEHVDVGSSSVVELESWAVAAQRLEEALAVLERYAGAHDPALGHRDWSSRRPNVLPFQRR